MQSPVQNSASTMDHISMHKEDLQCGLAKLSLQHVTPSLQKLGVRCLRDVLSLLVSDLEEAGLTRVQVRELQALANQAKHDEIDAASPRAASGASSPPDASSRAGSKKNTAGVEAEVPTNEPWKIMFCHAQAALDSPDKKMNDAALKILHKSLTHVSSFELSDFMQFVELAASAIRVKQSHAESQQSGMKKGGRPCRCTWNGSPDKVRDFQLQLSQLLERDDSSLRAAAPEDVCKFRSTLSALSLIAPRKNGKAGSHLPGLSRYAVQKLNKAPAAVDKANAAVMKVTGALATETLSSDEPAVVTFAQQPNPQTHSRSTTSTDDPSHSRSSTGEITGTIDVQWVPPATPAPYVNSSADVAWPANSTVNGPPSTPPGLPTLLGRSPEVKTTFIHFKVPFTSDASPVQSRFERQRQFLSDPTHNNCPSVLQFLQQIQEADAQQDESPSARDLRPRTMRM